MKKANKVVVSIHIIEKTLEPLQPNQRPPKPEINAPNKGNNKISKYINFFN